ncbi:MAG: TAXI family TRAP transporter solute-binding subunit [Parvibaculaceae bacterium]
MSNALKVVCVLAATLLATAGSAQGEDKKDIARMNAGAVTLITDGSDPHASHYAADLAVLMEAERDLRILPVLGRGPVEALRDLLFLRGIDAGIIPSDTVAYMRKQGLVEDVEKKVTYIARLGSAQLHVIARKDIATLKDLAGRRINIGAASEARFVTASLVFEALGIDFTTVDGREAEAAKLLEDGKADAVVLLAPQPSPVAEELARTGRFRLLGVAGNDELNAIYSPAMLTAKSYQGLAQEGGVTETLGVSYAVAVFNWKKGTDRYYKLRKFANALFSGIGDLQTGHWQATWNDVNLSADLPGWTRYVTADEWLSDHKRDSDDRDTKEETALKAEFQSYLERSNAGIDLSEMRSSALR